MASTRIVGLRMLRSNTCWQCRKSVVGQTRPNAFAQSYRPAQRAIGPRFAGLRWHSAPPGRGQVYEFDTVKSISESPSPDRVLVDVREPSEYEEGFIPGAINLPIKSQPDAIFLPEEEFEDRFGFSKPSPDKEIVFYCKSGVRSSAAAQLAQQHGYANVAEYRGSWLDWSKRGGTVQKP